MLLHFGVTPYLVFDGDRLPSKALTEKGRRERRKTSKEEGLRYLKLGKIPLAHQELQKAVDITPEMARMFIEALKASGVRYLVAPYEADSQMVYLERKGIVHGILSEDSDLLVFGAKRLLTKLDQYGECVLVDRDRFTACREINLTGWSNTEFRTMAILSGCDYLEGISKIGLKTAYRLVRKYKTINNILRGAMLEHKLRIPPNYLQDFTQADNTFLYQWVFCPTAEQLVHFNDLPRAIKDDALPFIGEHVDAEVARQVAEGELDPMTKAKIYLSSQQWGDVQKHLQKVPLRRVKNQPVTVTPNPKDPPSKSIESFFKRTRVPLAELDPNVFKPSESQQRLLNSQQTHEGWEARPSSNAENRLPPPVQRSYSAPISRFTEPQPAKRRRLCDDSPSKTAAQTERSRFFGSVNVRAEKSPLQPRKSKHKRGQLDFSIFSDDSMEGAMAEAADAAAESSGTKKMAVFRDDDAKHQEPILSAADHSLNTATIPQKSPSPESKDRSPFSATLRNETAALRERTNLESFALKRKYTTSALVDHPQNRPVSSPVQRRSTAPTTTGRTRPRKSSPLSPPLKASIPPGAAQDIVWDSPPAQYLVPADPHSAALSLKFETPTWTHDDSGYGSQLETCKGSEDWLVPRSDTETGSSRRGSGSGSVVDEACVPGSSPLRGRDEGGGRGLGLGRFAFGS